MAARWVGLTRPKNTKKSRARAVAKRDVVRDCLHALGASSLLLMAAAMNFALYPDALAAVVSGQPGAFSMVPAEQQFDNIAPIPTIEVNDEEVRLLAATAWGEARSEGEAGMRAVAHVMVNRIGPRFGEDLATVILSPKQFSVWNRGDPNRRLVLSLVNNPDRFSLGGAEWEAALRIAREVLSGQSADPTGGALFYHTQAVRPRWAGIGEGRQIIGAHVFYTDVPDRARRRTPRVIDIAQAFNATVSAGGREAHRRGPRAGRVNGAIQYASADAVRHELPSENVNAAATPTLNGVPITTASGAASD
jgi:spore germination cell wall hydrolase CwlJ-like protein